MKNISTDLKYYLSAISNFFAAIGGGIILGKGISIIDDPYLKEGSMLAFFMGTLFGIIFLKIIPKKISKVLAQCFSLLAGIISFILVFIFQIYSVDGKLINISAWIFFLFLSLRFGFWFYSRVFRAASVAGLQQKIAWVELGYYSGIISGLILWNILNINLGLITALIIDAILQFTAGFIDLFAHNNIFQKKSLYVPNIKNHIPDKNRKFWYWRLASAVALLTVGTQVIIFTLAHQASLYFTSYILAFYYIGVSIAAYFCRFFKIQINWEKYAFIKLHTQQNSTKINITWNIIFNALFVGLCVVGVNNHQMALSLGKINITSILLLTFVTISAFFYEIFALTILDRIGLEERTSGSDGMVIHTYALMGISATISLWILGIVQYSMTVLLTTLSFCFILPLVFIVKSPNLKKNMSRI